MILDKSWDHPSIKLVTFTIPYYLSCSVTGIFKIHNDLAPNYLNTILLFTSNSRYELRSESRCHLAQPKKKSYYSNLTLVHLVHHLE